MENKKTIIKEEETVMLNEEQNVPKKNYLFSGMRFQTKLIIVLLLALALVIGALLAILGNNDDGTTITSTSSLESVLEIKELSMVEYIYNAIATKYDKNNNPMYHVAYEGTVIAGIEFDDIKIDVEENEKKIIITIPEIKIQDVKVDESTLDYMFLKSKYETETIAQEAYKLCIEDLKVRITEENILYDTAKTNAKFSLEAMFKPWIETIDDTYTVEIK